MGIQTVKNLLRLSKMKLLFSSVILAAAAQDYYADYYAYNGTGVDYGTGEDGDSRAYAPAEPAYPAQPSYPVAPSYPAASYGGKMSCWHCDAMSFEECERKGEERQCHDNEGTCFLEIRERREGRKFTQICMGCKSKDACENMKAQNFQNSNPDYTQCRPESQYKNSVCRQCCTEPNCTKSPTWWYPTTRAEWDYSGEETPY